MFKDKNDLVSMLNEIASYERGFKQQAFSNAATSIAVLSNKEFEEAVENNKVQSLPGVGKSIKSCIEEYIETGTITRLENYRSSGSLKIPDFS